MTHENTTKALLIITDQFGNTILRKEFDDYPYQIGWSILRSNSNEIIGVGEIERDSKKSIWIYKINSEGGMVWQNIVESEDYSERAFYIDQLADDTFVVTVTATKSDKSKDDVLIMKFNSKGEVIWKKIIEVTENRDVGHALKVENGTINVFGYYQVENSENFNPLVIQMDDNGKILSTNKIQMPDLDIRCMNGSVSPNQTIMIGYARDTKSDYFKACILTFDNENNILSLDTIGQRGRNTGYGLRRTKTDKILITGAIVTENNSDQNAFIHILNE